MAIYHVNIIKKISEIVDEVQKMHDLEKNQFDKQKTSELLLSMLQQLQIDFKQFSKDIDERHSCEIAKNHSFYEKIMIEYSTESDFSDIYQIKEIEDACLSSAALNAMIYSERDFRNMNYEGLHARVTLITLDSNFEG